MPHTHASAEIQTLYLLLVKSTGYYHQASTTGLFASFCIYNTLFLVYYFALSQNFPPFLIKFTIISSCFPCIHVLKLIIIFSSLIFQVQSSIQQSQSSLDFIFIASSTAHCTQILIAFVCVMHIVLFLFPRLMNAAIIIEPQVLSTAMKD